LEFDRATVANLTAFIASGDHAANVSGQLQIGGSKAPAAGDATIEVFPENVVGHEMFMRYFLPYFNSSGAALHLEGQKNIEGEYCISSFEPMMTTLYFYIREGCLILMFGKILICLYFFFF
jgi:hypothetical protein